MGKPTVGDGTRLESGRAYGPWEFDPPSIRSEGEGAGSPGRLLPGSRLHRRGVRVLRPPLRSHRTQRPRGWRVDRGV